MRRPISLSHVVRRLGMRTQQPGKRAGQGRKRAGLFLVAGLILVSMLLSACSGLFGSGSSTTPTPSTRGLSKLDWCAKPLMVFRDEGAITPVVTPTTTATATGTATASGGTPTTGPGTPSTISDWSVVKANLGFTVYLPLNLPNGTCLFSAQATIHDPVFGGSFIIGYLLPDHSSLSLSEAPRTPKSQGTAFQCNPTSIATTPTATSSKTGGTPTSATPSPTANANQLCSGVKDTTNIVLSGPGSVSNLQQIFNNLQPDVNWIPVS